MSILESILDATPRLVERPEPFGAFHLVSVAVILLAAVVMVILRRRLPHGEKHLRCVLMIFGLGLLALEIGKQILYSYDPVDGWGYDWSRFPFQFCSMPIYVALVAMCQKNTRCRRTLLAFLATYSPVGGAAVLLWPRSDVFHEILFLDVHTMLWHGAMLLFALYLWLVGAVTPTWKTAVRAFAVFLPLNFLALGLNEAAYAWNFAAGYEFNMFYIGRLGDCGIPVLSFIQDTCPYPVFFSAYVLVLGLGGLLVTLGAMAIVGIARRQREITG